MNKINLSYKDTERSILTEYFQISPMLSSNYVKVDVYLTPKEFESIKNGALVKFDDDLYYVAEIQGHDPSGKNETTLKLIKKV
jgi:RNA recognition motif-containing protein